jgi:hypothetical protein
LYRHTGKVSLADRELPGFIGNRLQEALWREALHMVGAGEATVDQSDASVAWGPDLRRAPARIPGGPGTEPGRRRRMTRDHRRTGLPGSPWPPASGGS